MPELPQPALWASVAAGTLLGMVLFVLAIDDAARAARRRDWPRLSVFALATLAAFGGLVLLAVRLGVVPGP